MLNKLIYLLLLPVVACNNPTPDVRQLMLPATQFTVTQAPTDTLATFIRNTFPGCRICTQADYDNSFWSFYDTTYAMPWYAAVDINDDQRTDMAMLIKEQQTLKLLLLMGTDTGYNWQWVEDFSIPLHNNQKVTYGLHPEPPGQIDIAYPTITSLILPSNGINLYYFENRHALYYWNGNRIAVFKTS
ncbi:hypothetical protein HNQ91_000967 [Filimonas zeae]|uniref:Uncharacterized protein n=1 Tax=Filimonas zeae TaxID=1737353 RepID=A0A917IQZ9_9BACT|nr:hypothetical protein [Filimonas zeae]MDR6337945.1 hypothetical protein [Filimonas zeae]GGH60984.1 hypothetical protein GCM10011379_09460 [Filimonas zeae]